LTNNQLTAQSIYQQSQQDYVSAYLDSLPLSISVPLISEWAEENRVLPPDPQGYSGKWLASMVPHLVQPLNDCHPDQPYTHITNIKSVQSANTVSLAENVLGFWIKYKIGSTLFLTSTKNMANVRGSANIDTMIDYSGLADCLKPASNRTGKKNKDNSLYKEFDGGIKLMMTSYSSIADLKSNTFNLIIEDELDECPPQLKDQGDTEMIIEGRTMALTNYKILQISTSSGAGGSRIYKNFLKGDQNEYFVPCPICGENQILQLKKRGEKYGLTHKSEKGKNDNKRKLIPGTVEYVCKFCEGSFRESKKYDMLRSGIWIPQATPDDPLRRSYHSSGLISPFLPWERIVKQFIASNYGQDLPVFKDFTINYLGNPWLNVGKSGKWEELKKRAEDYTMGEIPKGVVANVSGVDVYDGGLMLFGGVDVQGDRLELLVTAFGINGNKWIIDHKVFFGDTKNLDDPCWKTLHDFVYEKRYTICGSNNNAILKCAIDAGYNPIAGDKRKKDFANKSHVVYDFVALRTDRFMAIMGNPGKPLGGIIAKKKISDSVTMLTDRYMVDVSMLKESIYDVIGSSEGYNTIHVPKWAVYEGTKQETSDEFFMQFMSERLQEDPKTGKMKWCKLRNRNEILDIFIYSISAAAFWNVQSYSMQNWSEYYYGLIGE